MAPNGRQYDTEAVVAPTSIKTERSHYEILRKHVNECKIIPPGSFVSNIILTRLDEEEGKTRGSSTRTSSNTGMMTSSNNTEMMKDISTLRRHIYNCKHIPPSSNISRLILMRLDERTHQLQTHQPPPPPTPPLPSKPPPSPPPTTKSHPLLPLLRFLLLDTTLLLLFSLLLLTTSLHLYYTTYLTPILQTSDWITPTEPTGQPRLQNEFTYYERRCGASDVSTRSMEDLRLGGGDGEEEAVENFMVHGATVFPGLLRDETAEALRGHILGRNGELTEDESIPLDGPENRYSYGIGANDDPTVTKALQEISSNPLLTKSLTTLLGPNPAVSEITAITTNPGAQNQGWHSDVKAAGNSVKYSRTFTHSYSLFIPLQNVTVEMGATEICPGTHLCPNELEDTCTDAGFPAVPEEEGVWRMGDALVMNQCMWHRGPAYTAPGGPSRVVFILTFLSRPDYGKDPRQLAHGTYFHIRPDMYGFTMEDMRDPSLRMKAPFSWLRSMGVWKPPHLADWGWDMPTMTLLRIANEENGYHPEDLPYFLSDHGLGKSIPRVLHGGVVSEEDGGGGWRVYLEETAWNFTVAAGFVYVLVLVVVLTGAVLVDEVFGVGKGGGGRRGRYCRSVLVRTLWVDFVLVSLAYGMYRRFVGTPWCRGIESGAIFKRPFVGRSFANGAEDYVNDDVDTTSLSSFSSSLPSIQRPQYGSRPTTVPENMDVLFSTRFDSKNIGYYRHFLNYHPGNVKFNHDIALRSATYASYTQIPNIFTHRLVDEILQNVSQTGSRFLSQNDYGEWTVMDQREVEEMIVKRLLAREYGVFAALDDELSFLIAANDEAMKHHGEEGAFRRMAGENLLWWRGIIDRRLLGVGAIASTTGTIGSGNEILKSKPRQISRPSLFEVNPYVPPSSPRSTAKPITRSERGTLIQKLPRIKEGDKVYAHDGGSESGWQIGIVVAVMGKKAVVRSAHDDNGGNKWRFMTQLDNVRPFRSFTTGDTVEVLLDVWTLATIARAYPDRTYDLWYWDEDDDGEEIKAFEFRIPDDDMEITFLSYEL